MNGRTVVITGATNGIGRVTARELAKAGARVIMVVRNPEKARATEIEIESAAPDSSVRSIIADLSVMDEVRKAADEIIASEPEIHVLINNAGMITTSRTLTVDGFEKTFAVNHLSHFLLTHRLLDTLSASGRPGRTARIITVSSGAHAASTMDFDNLQAEKRFGSFDAYGRSKLANIMFTYALARRLSDAGAPVATNSLHPGFVNSGFGSQSGGFIGVLSRVVLTLSRPFQRSPEKGAETSIYLASSPDAEGVSGRYFVDRSPRKSSAASYCTAAQERLWRVSEELTSVR